MSGVAYAPADTKRGIANVRDFLDNRSRDALRNAPGGYWSTLALGNMRSLLRAYEEIERLREALVGADRFAVHRGNRCVEIDNPERCDCGFAEWRETADVALVGEEKT